ncbi:MerR family transcriptional regulator [Actinoallomurus sp. CA-142502]|uniref:DNA polymerase III subunit beta family protein n=1 Tax=Actinoallomurus sp. CA-142502 TaxID=3239885 RepID=UPI003D93825D
MDDSEGFVSIGAFAHRVGLAPSALRFYDDCGVLRPAFVDEATGYRYYHPDQEPRAVLVRRLRKAGLPLTEATLVLDGPRAQARAVLEEHLERARETAAAARSAIESILRDLAPGEPVCGARVGGAELASAVRQVAPAVADPAVAGEFPVLGGVLVELDGQELRLVATDRYRLAVRTLRAELVEGGPGRVVADAAAMKEVAAWAVRHEQVEVELDGFGARVRGGGRVRTLPAVEGTFPDYRMLLEDRPAVRHRLIADRAALRDRLAEAGETVTLHAEDHRVRVVGGEPPEAAVPAIRIGPPLSVAFDPVVLVAALDAGVGPDVLLEVCDPRSPVVVRSADQGSFTTLVMPVLPRPERQA